MADMPPGFPTADKFPADQVREHEATWDFDRDPGQGGKNFGQDNLTPNDTAVVGFDIHIVSDHNTDGRPNIHLIMKSLNVVQMPVGVHVGHRLEPGGVGGPGAKFKGKVVMKIVSPQAWLQKALENIPL